MHPVKTALPKLNNKSKYTLKIIDCTIISFDSLEEEKIIF